MLFSIDNLISAIRFCAGFLLIVIAARAYLRTKIPAMLLLMIGFSLITVGDLFSSLYYIEDAHMDKVLSNVFDIFGLIALIVAVRKS